ncbi:hypothetical protein DICVIV_04083 [Dictyocaulus viviparus]|uniref:Cyclin-dependent kinase inhibitor domain-containing protein n=1 Tax=Dictyocaulus viviparus TaxID=29172 RepID=A0A0D8XYN7_DICVI|nr:hypothetical protein DICVIV_04083 [Dictyocaulus viviparus]
MENDSPGIMLRKKRCLFGKPDRNEVENWLSETTKKQLKNSRVKWSYDFELDKPVCGDVEYERLPIDKAGFSTHYVPSVYKPLTVRKKKVKKAEFDPNIPSVSTKQENDINSSIHRPLTRSFVRQQSGEDYRCRRSLKQAKLTNYLRVRKRRSVESRSPKQHVASLKSIKSNFPSSPFRFVDDVDGDGAIPSSNSLRSFSSSPSKSPRKRPAHKIPQEFSSQVSKFHSQIAADQ